MECMFKQVENVMIEFKDQQNVLHVVCEGELTRNNHEKYARLIGEKLVDFDGCVIDLKDVSYMDTSGLGILVSSMRECRKQEKWFGVRCDSKELMRLIQITKLDLLFPVAGTLDEIRNAWSSGACQMQGIG